MGLSWETNVAKNKFDKGPLNRRRAWSHKGHVIRISNRQLIQNYVIENDVPR